MTQVRYAVVGLGYISQVAMLPAFRGARRNSRLAAVVSGSARKLAEVGRKYDVPLRADYDGYDDLLRSGDIDAVYIGLPNTMHRDFAERALKAGVHVLCDKPLAMTVADCRALVKAARRRRVKLMTAYRLHFEAANLAALELLHSREIGELRFFTSQFALQVRPRNIRTRAETGGGPLFDLGIYCVNAARHVFRAEPVEVFAAMIRGRDRRFREVEETAQVQMRFPDDRLASFTCSFGAADASAFHVWGTKGSVRLDQAYEMAGPRFAHIELRRNGSVTKRSRRYGPTDQFAPLLVHFSSCVLEDREPVPNGDEGLADIRVLEAIVRSGQKDAPVRLSPTRFRGVSLDTHLAHRVPPHRRPDLVQAHGPSQ
jgi:glucose-fructose oxidoreductase